LRCGYAIRWSTRPDLADSKQRKGEESERKAVCDPYLLALEQSELDGHLALITISQLGLDNNKQSIIRILLGICFDMHDQ
jgi:hypothetical protein